MPLLSSRTASSLSKAEDYPDVLHRSNEYKAQGRIEFTTFHQSYGYEEFIEGIKPSVDSEEESGDIQYSVKPGVFKRFCERADCPAAANAETYGIEKTRTFGKCLCGALVTTKFVLNVSLVDIYESDGTSMERTSQMRSNFPKMAAALY
ncbi:MAG: hypothetical protein V8S77_09845 [Oscillospiraceae bacterium]